jgi:RimJ/RimL family protein N-acetyltransferase
MIHPKRLDGNLIRLVEMEVQHLCALETIASNPIIWQNLPVEGWRKDSFRRWAYDSLELQKNGQAFVFVVIDQNADKIVGTTRFQDMDRQHNKTDIGWTWYEPTVWGLGHNFEAKKMMMTHAFEVWNVARIGFKVDERNLRSQRALEKIGASREGIIRKHMIRPDGTSRNSVLYGMTDEDWLLNVQLKSQFSMAEDTVEQRNNEKAGKNMVLARA